MWWRNIWMVPKIQFLDNSYFMWMEIYFVYLHKTKIGKKINYRPASYRDYVKYERTCSFARILFYSQWWPGVFFFRSKHCDPHPRNSSFCRQNALMYFWSSIADLTTVYNLAKMFLKLYLNYYNSTISSDIICITIWSLAICFRHLLSKFSNDSYLSNQMALEFF